MSALPEPYALWVEQILGREPEPEPLSTCDSCPCAGVTMHAHTKCCSSPAVVPNYLVGRVLDEPSVSARIAARIGVGPSGLGTGRAGSDPSVFVANPLTSRCPHYLEASGGCGIHRARPAMCATYFCRHSQAARGAAAWEALRHALHLVEPRLALWAAREAGLEAGPLHALFTSGGRSVDGPDPVSDAVWAARWGSFAGREIELFRIAAERVAELTWAEVVVIAGVESDVLGQTARSAFEGLEQTAVPEVLRVGAHSVVGLSADTLRLVVHSPHQPYDVSPLVHSTLVFFDGRPTHDALAAMAEERGIQLDDALIRELLDVGLLVPG